MMHLRNMNTFKIIFSIVVTLFVTLLPLFQGNKNSKNLRGDLRNSEKGVADIWYKNFKNRVPSKAPSFHQSWRDRSNNKVCLQGCKQDDERLIQLVKLEYLMPPSKLPYRFIKPSPALEGQIGQSSLVDGILEEQTQGFFVEAGAHDGEGLSNSLFFEMKRNWTGLLVEADPKSFEKLNGKHRKAYSIQACLSVTSESMIETFIEGGVVGGLEIMEDDYMKNRRMKGFGGKSLSKFSVQCFPFYSIIAALGNPVIDYFSLDVEGAELAILKTIPWKLVDIRVLTIEYNRREGFRTEIVNFMEPLGYEVVRDLRQDLVMKKSS